MLKRATGRPIIPHKHALDTPLLTFSKGDSFTIRDACQGVQIFGGTGSGKTSGSGRALAQAYLRAGFGGIVCCAQPSEPELWRRLAKECNRQDDLIFVDRSGEHRFNFLDYAAATIGVSGFENNLVDMLARITEAARAQRNSGNSGENQFFRDAAMQLVANCLPFLRTAYGTIRLDHLVRFITSAPQSREQTTDSEWMATSFCSTTIKIVGTKAQQGNAEAFRVFEQHSEYWLNEFARTGDKTQGSIISTLTSTLYPFLSGILRDLFTTNTTIVPDMCRHGAIIVLDLPVRELGASGNVAQQIFKLLFQLCMERQALRDDDETRPVFCWADECQFFMNGHDTDHLSVCRKQKVANVFITQDMPTYKDRMDSDAAALSLLNKFGTRIFHATTDQETATYAADIIGKIDHFMVDEGQQQGINTGGGVNVGDGTGSSGGYGRTQGTSRNSRTYQDYDIAPDYFGRELRTGGKLNKQKVDGIIIINGRNFRSSGRNRIKAEFTQA